MQKIKKNDVVKIIAGKDKDKTGKVLDVLVKTEKSLKTKKPVKTMKVVVEGCNMHTKHQKKTQDGQNLGIIKKEAPLDISNVMLLVDGKTTRVGFALKNNKKVRLAVKTGKEIK